MPHLSADAKHHILLEYASHSATHGFPALAARHAVAGGARTVQRWYQRWDGTPASLEEQPRTGRPRALSKAEVSRHVRAPILAANRSHRAISYTQLLPAVQAKTRVELSVRTLRRYGKEEHGAKHKHTKKRTAAESECIATSDRLHASASVERCS
jgi:transposase